MTHPSRGGRSPRSVRYYSWMNLRTYETDGRALYARLAALVAEILNTVIRQQAELRLQQIQHRAKDPSSLRKKLERTGALDSDDIGAAAKDLAGCRAVFYTNSDVARFQLSGLIIDNFVVDWACRFQYFLSNPSAINVQFPVCSAIQLISETSIQRERRYSGGHSA